MASINLLSLSIISLEVAHQQQADLYSMPVYSE
jgi:hypothetical protein